MTESQWISSSCRMVFLTACKTPLSALQGWTCGRFAGGDGTQKSGAIEKKSAARAKDVLRDTTLFFLSPSSAP